MYKIKRSVYKAIVNAIGNELWDLRALLPKLQSGFPDVPVETLRSIVVQEIVKSMKRSYSRQSPANAMKMYRMCMERMQKPEYRPGEGVIVDIGKSKHLPSSVVAKLVLEKRTGSPQVGPLMKNSNLIDDGPLAYEVLLACLNDGIYGHVSDCIRNSIGQAYERRLKQQLRNLDLSFLDEDQLRARGYDKTPDVKLESPIAVGGYIINWIESKAQFGDDDNHSTYLKDQLWSYWNRFGPGLVIYWFGFIEDLDCTRDQGIVVSDSFPELNSIVKLDSTFGLDGLLDSL